MRVFHQSIAVIAAITVFLAFGIYSLAQGSRTIHGFVVDQSAHRLEGAVVQVEDTQTLTVRSYITKADGAFHFVQLSPDRDYEVKAVYDGIRSDTRRVTRFDSDPKNDVKLTVRLGK